MHVLRTSRDPREEDQRDNEIRKSTPTASSASGVIECGRCCSSAVISRGAQWTRAQVYMSCGFQYTAKPDARPRIACTGLNCTESVDVSGRVLRSGVRCDLRLGLIIACFPFSHNPSKTLDRDRALEPMPPARTSGPHKANAHTSKRTP